MSDPPSNFTGFSEIYYYSSTALAYTGIAFYYITDNIPLSIAIGGLLGLGLALFMLLYFSTYSTETVENYIPVAICGLLCLMGFVGTAIRRKRPSPA